MYGRRFGAKRLLSEPRVKRWEIYRWCIACDALRKSEVLEHPEWVSQKCMTCGSYSKKLIGPRKTPET